MLQVETPVLETSAGGADARPFTTFHNALQQPYALRIATGAPLFRLGCCSSRLAQCVPERPCHAFLGAPLRGLGEGTVDMLRST